MNATKRYPNGVVAVPCKHCGAASVETNPEHMHDECGDCIAEPPTEAQRAYERAFADTAFTDVDA